MMSTALRWEGIRGIGGNLGCCTVGLAGGGVVAHSSWLHPRRARLSQLKRCIASSSVGGRMSGFPLLSVKSSDHDWTSTASRPAKSVEKDVQLWCNGRRPWLAKSIMKSYRILLKDRVQHPYIEITCAATIPPQRCRCFSLIMYPLTQEQRGGHQISSLACYVPCAR